MATATEVTAATARATPSTSTNEFCHSASGKTAAIAVEQRELPSFRRGTSRNNAVSRKLVNRLQADPAVPPGELAETMSHLASGVSCGATPVRFRALRYGGS